VILAHARRYRGGAGQGEYDMLRFERATVRVDTAPPPRAWQQREALPSRRLLGTSEPPLVAELHMRLNSPFQVLTIALWAPLLARARPREGRYGRIVAAVLIQAIYFNLVGVGESWLIQGVVVPGVGLWWAHGLFVLLGLGLLLRQYARGPGWRLFRPATWTTGAPR